jgi:hypothetical protein
MSSIDASGCYVGVQYIQDQVTGEMREVVEADFKGDLIDTQDLSYPAPPPPPPKVSSCLPPMKSAFKQASKYSLPIITAIVGLAWIIVSQYTDTLNDRYTIMGFATFFLGLSVFCYHDVLKKGNKNAVKIATLVALAILCAEFAAGPKLGLFPTQGPAITFFLSALATLFAAKAVHELTKREKEAVKLIIGAVAFILGTEYAVINGGTVLACAQAAHAVVCIGIVSGTYFHLKDQKRDARTAGLVALGLIFGHIAYFGYRYDGLDIQNTILFGGMGVGLLGVFGFHTHESKNKLISKRR